MTERFSADDASATPVPVDGPVTTTTPTVGAVPVEGAGATPADDARAAPVDDARATPVDDAGATRVDDTRAAPVAQLSRTARVGHWLRVAVAGVFGIVYAYYLWDAIRSLIELPAQYEVMGFSRDDAPWSLLILGIILPIVTYVGALIVGRHRNVFVQALVLLAGLGALAALSLGVIALA
jgi:hypothetical protein